MTLPETIGPKIIRLIPRLASEHEGEILGTVAAIRRALHGAGLDLHDLARAIGANDVSNAQLPASGAAVAVAPKWKELSHFELCAWMDALILLPEFTAWEKELAHDLRERVRQHRYLTPKPIRQIDELLARAFALGARP